MWGRRERLSQNKLNWMNKLVQFNISVSDNQASQNTPQSMLTLLQDFFLGQWTQSGSPEIYSLKIFIKHFLNSYLYMMKHFFKKIYIMQHLLQWTKKHALCRKEKVILLLAMHRFERVLAQERYKSLCEFIYRKMIPQVGQVCYIKH